MMVAVVIRVISILIGAPLCETADISSVESRKRSDATPNLEKTGL